MPNPGPITIFGNWGPITILGIGVLQYNNFGNWVLYNFFLSSKPLHPTMVGCCVRGAGEGAEFCVFEYTVQQRVDFHRLGSADGIVAIQ